MNNRGFFLNQQDRDLVWHPFALPHADNILIKKAKGVYLIDFDNKKYIDAVSSWWVNVHGHGNLKLGNALSKQFRKADQIIFSGFTHEPGIRLAKELLTRTSHKYGSVFYSDNGSTAIEVALKLGIQYLIQQGNKKIKIISFENAYHGDTFGAMASGGKSIFNEVFTDFMFESTQIPLPTKENLDSIFKTIDENTKKNDAVIFIYEPLIQGAGGMNIYCIESLTKLILKIKESNSICIADEVMTGFYRTGTFIASEQVWSINPAATPDLMCLSKGITGGIMPLSATLIKKEITNWFATRKINDRFYHGHSYTGNPLACALALESLKLFNKKTLNNIQQIHKLHHEFLIELNKSSFVKNTSVSGTILRFEIATQEGDGYTNSMRDTIYSYFISNGVLLRPLGNVIYIMPPYSIQKKELNIVYKTILAFLKKLDN